LKAGFGRYGLALVLALALAGGVLYVAVNFLSKPALQKRTRLLMDTYCSISVPGDARVIPVIDRVLDHTEALDKKFNCLNPKSVIYAFNHRNVPITDPEIVKVLALSLQVARESNGIFDITVYPLVKLWGFYDKAPQRVPDPVAIRAALAKVDYRAVVIRDGKVYKLRPEIMIDLGGVAKGYAVGEAARQLTEAGIKSALVDFGGDVYAVGKLRGHPWRVGLQNPRGPNMLAVMELSDLSIATSGDYQRFFEIGGKRYHHIMDPATGYPSYKLISLTVIMQDATLTDAWTKVFFILGKEKALALAAQKPDLEIIGVDPDGKVFCSPGLEKNLQIQQVMEASK
jgi:FAD:protein FMN transferase